MKPKLSSEVVPYNLETKEYHPIGDKFKVTNSPNGKLTRSRKCSEESTEFTRKRLFPNNPETTIVLKRIPIEKQPGQYTFMIEHLGESIELPSIQQPLKACSEGKKSPPNVVSGKKSLQEPEELNGLEQVSNFSKSSTNSKTHSTNNK